MTPLYSATSIDSLVEQLTVFGIEFQVWQFVYLGLGAIALIYAGKSRGD
jgi:hypothetical protein